MRKKRKHKRIVPSASIRELSKQIETSDDASFMPMRWWNHAELVDAARARDARLAHEARMYLPQRPYSEPNHAPRPGDPIPNTRGLGGPVRSLSAEEIAAAYPGVPVTSRE
jgi:hypothetical protein